MNQQVIAVVGSRAKGKDYNKRIGKLVYMYMIAKKNQDVIWLSGGAASGADYWCRKYCSDFKWSYLEAPAFWNKLYLYNPTPGDYDKSAGPRRNKTIAAICTDAVAFWDGKSPGTLSTINLLKGLGKPLEVIRIDEVHPLNELPLPKTPPRPKVKE